MKASLHFPVEQYGFAEVEIEVESPQEAIQAYKAATIEQKGLEKKEYDRFVDSYLSGDTNGLLPLYEQMNDEQKLVVQCIKRSLARIHAKVKKEEDLNAKDRND